MQHLMIDLETLGIRPDSAILSIGACFFDPDTGFIGEKFYQRIDFSSAMNNGKSDPETIRWWFQQSEQARSEIVSPGIHHREALMKLYDFIEKWSAYYKTGDTLQVWFNGSGFDIVMIEHAFYHNPPWRYYNCRDVRTVVELAKGLVDKKSVERKGPAHHALYDAVWQAEYVSAMWQALKKNDSKFTLRPSFLEVCLNAYEADNEEALNPDSARIHREIITEFFKKSGLLLDSINVVEGVV